MSHQYYKFEMVTMDKLFWCAIRPNQKKKKKEERTVKFYMSLLNNE